jgi:hypothetical protein
MLADLRATFEAAGIRIESMTVEQDDARPAPRVVGRRRRSHDDTRPLFNDADDDAA